MSSGRDSARRDLAAAVHETTNALTVILGWVERAREECNDPAVERSLARAARYTRDARRTMRLAIGADEEPPAPAPAAAIAERVEEDLAMEARRSSVDLAVEAAFTDDALLAIANPDAAWQILTNLVLNAIAMSPEEGSVTIQCLLDGEQVAYHVDDDGPGVPEDQREAIFEGKVRQRKGGAGIGLRHARALARELGGDLTVGDTPDGVGARFTLLWPVAELAPAAPEEAKPAAATKRRKPSTQSLAGSRLLLLEDDHAVVELLELSLGARGADLRCVHTAEGLRSALADGEFDVVLMDLSPLAPDGPPTEDSSLDAAIAQARAANPGIDVVVISGSVTVQPRPDVLWVRKPFEPRELVDTILRHRETIAPSDS